MLHGIIATGIFDPGDPVALVKPSLFVWEE
jgi:hypothetical protein